MPRESKERIVQACVSQQADEMFEERVSQAPALSGAVACWKHDHAVEKRLGNVNKDSVLCPYTGQDASKQSFCSNSYRQPLFFSAGIKKM